VSYDSILYDGQRAAHVTRQPQEVDEIGRPAAYPGGTI
jgi:hypothetical protein